MYVQKTLTALSCIQQSTQHKWSGTLCSPGWRANMELEKEHSGIGAAESAFLKIMLAMCPISNLICIIYLTILTRHITGQCPRSLQPVGGMR